MSTVKSKKLQVGTDATSSNNFTIYQPAVPDGTLRIGVGNADSPTEVGQFNVNGYKPAVAPLFSARPNGNKAISSATWTKLAADVEIHDSTNDYDHTTNYRFTPSVAGYYLLNLSVRFENASGGTYHALNVYKNGSAFAYVNANRFTVSANAMTIPSGSQVIYLNGSTDYIEAYCYVNVTTNMQSDSRFQAYLIQQA